MVCVDSLCVDVDMLMNVHFLSYICFYMLCMWFHGWIEVWEGEWMSFNCFSNWAREFLQGVQSNCLQGVRWQKGSIRDNFCSHFLEGAVKHSVVQGVRRSGKRLRDANLSKVLKTAAARSAQSRETSTLCRGWRIAARSACKEFSLSKRPSNCVKLRSDRPSNSLKDEAGKLCLDSWKECRRFARRVTSSMEERLVIS